MGCSRFPVTLLPRENVPGTLLMCFTILSSLLLGGCGSGAGPLFGGGDVEIPPFDLFGSIIIADFDGDGRLDIAAAYSHVAGPPPHPGYIRVWLQKQNGAFVRAGDYAVGADPNDMFTADLNGDGVTDIVVGSATAAVDGPPVDVITVLFGDGARPGSFLAPKQLHTGARIDRIAVSDLDGDGLPDIAATLYNNTSGIVVFWQDVAVPGQFSAPDFVVTGEAFTLAVGDLNADGRPDLVFVRGNTIMYAQHDKSQAHRFASPVPILSGQNVSALGIADLDHDGFDDLIVANRITMDAGSSGYLLVARGAPTMPGMLIPPERYPLFAAAFALVYADLNGDGFLDIVTGEPYGLVPSDHRVEVFLQKPLMQGMLENPVMNSVAPAFAYQLAAGDVNDDGLPEVFAGGNNVFQFMQNKAQPGTLQVPPILLP